MSDVAAGYISEWVLLYMVWLDQGEDWNVKSSWQYNHWQARWATGLWTLPLINPIIFPRSFMMAVANYALSLITNCLFVIKVQVIIIFYVENVNLFKNIFKNYFLCVLNMGVFNSPDPRNMWIILMELSIILDVNFYYELSWFLWTPQNLHFNKSLE